MREIKEKALDRILIAGGTLIDGTGRTPIKDSAVLIDGFKIVSVGNETEVEAPSNTRVLDASGKTVMPGMIDLHMHIAGTPRDPTEPNYGTWACMEYTFMKTPLTMLLLYGVRNCRLLIEAGFTTVREMLGYSAHDNISLRKGVELKLFPGPRIFATGSVVQTGGHFDMFPWLRQYAQPEGWASTGPWECRRKVREHVGRGVDGIKTVTGHHNVYPYTTIPPPTPYDCVLFTQEELDAIVDEAHRFGKPVTAHGTNDEAVIHGCKAGLDSIDHGCHRKVMSDEAIEAMKKAGTIFVPTLCVGSDKAIEAREKMGLGRYGEESVKSREESLRKAYKAGVKIACGSDTYRTLLQHVGENAYELELMVRYGMSEMDAIVAATKTSAEALWWQNRIGTIEPGKLADVLIINGNPLNDIKILQDKDKIELVIKNGEIVVDRRDGFTKLLY